MQNPEILDTTTTLFTEAINFALIQSMEKFDNLLCFGLGINDPKRIFGTTIELLERFGEKRIFDVPTSENALTGISVGLAIAGYRNVVVHQRMDFFLLAMDQLVNSAAKWHYMFGGVNSVPITIRLIVGKGWGQGPTHSQSFHSWFAHVPGLKVILPSTPRNAKALLLASIEDPNPVIFIEHRWLHDMRGEVDSKYIPQALDKATVTRLGSDVTIVTSSYLTPRFTSLYPVFDDLGISPEHIDLISMSPIDWETICDSVRKTGRLLVLDFAPETASISAEIIAKVTTDCFESLKCAPIRLASPNIPEPTSHALIRNFHYTDLDIVRSVQKLLGRVVAKNWSEAGLVEPKQYDVPNEYFKGPF